MRVLVGAAIWLVSLASFAELPMAVLEASVEKHFERAIADDRSPAVHALRESQQSVESARRKINAWIRYNFQLAFAYKSKGDTENALLSYLTARHALRDSTSP